jgi:hypothetical protein
VLGAVAVVGGRASNLVKVTEGPTEAIRAIEVVSHSAVKDRTRAANQFHSLVVTAPVMLQESLRNLSLVQQLRRARRFRSNDDVVEHHARQALKALSVRIGFLDDQIADLKATMNTLAAQATPAVTD